MHRENEEEQGIYNQYFNDLGVQFQTIEFPTMSRYKIRHIRDNVYFSNCGFWAIAAFENLVGICGYKDGQWIGVRMLHTKDFDDRCWCINYALESFEDDLLFFCLCNEYDDPYQYVRKEVLDLINFVREKADNNI